MSDTKLSDKEAFDILVRAGRKRNKVDWVLGGDQADINALNDAIRKAGGHDPQHEGQEQGTFPWTSIAEDTHAGDEKGS